MANCEVIIQRIVFNFEDPDMTEVQVHVATAGDCPHTLPGIYQQRFPARIPADAILRDEVGTGKYLTEWPH